MSDDEYELFAIRFGELPRNPRDNVLRPTDRSGPPGMYYYVWAARNASRTVVVDTGFSTTEADRRGRVIQRPVTEGLHSVGVDPTEVTHVVLSHLHYDHAGNTNLFPSAHFHLQSTELQFVRGEYMRHREFSAHYAPDDVDTADRLLDAGRLTLHDGTAEIAPGMSLHRIGGHTPGTQGVLVRTKRGPVFVASDSVHFYENFDDRNAFPVLFHHGELLDGYERISQLIPDGTHLVPGHDRRVVDRYPAPDPSLAGWVACLHQHPSVDDGERRP